jgi:hypothetical protein
VSERKNPIEQALDFFVFAPIGFVLSATETIPELAEKGRGYVAAARMMGEFAIGQGREKAESAVGLRRPAPPPAPEGAKARTAAGERAAPAPTPPPAPQAPPTPPAPPAGSVPPPAPEGAQARADAATATAGNGAMAPPSADALAIPGYDTLSASQVVQRLGGLSGEELEAVRAYEAAGRRRKTILSRVAQLQSGS